MLADTMVCSVSEVGVADVSVSAVIVFVENTPVVVSVTEVWPKHDDAASPRFSVTCSITERAHCCSSIQLLSGTGCSKSVPVGCAVIPVKDVIPVPEQAVMVEQSVTKLLVTVPETKFVPTHFGIAVGLHDWVIAVAANSGVWEQAVTVVQNVV
jgi:hypothetical protein